MKVYYFLPTLIILLFGYSFASQAQKTEEDIDKKISKPKIMEAMLSPIEELPRYPACEDKGLNKKDLENCAKEAFLVDVYQNLVYPVEAKDKNIEGMVLIRFYIDEKGKMIDLKILRDIGYGCGEAALKVFERMKDEITWIPGTQRLKPVKVLYTMPVKFKL